MKAPHSDILLVGGSPEVILTFVRSLARQGHRLDSLNDTPLSHACQSRYLQKVLPFPHDPKEAQDRLIKALAEGQYDHIVPLDANASHHIQTTRTQYPDRFGHARIHQSHPAPITLQAPRTSPDVKTKIIGLLTFAHNQEITAAVQFRSLRHDTRGHHGYCVSEAPNEQILRLAEQFIRLHRLEGPITLYFAYTPGADGYHIIGAIPHWDDALPLAVHVGADLPIHWIAPPQAATPMPSYRPGIYCRNGRHDSLLLQKAFGQARRKGTRQLFGTLARTFLEILRPAWRKEVHGSHAWQDPNPQWTEYARILAQLVSDASARIATLRRWQARQRARRVHHRIRLDEQADRSTRLLSLCFGNICRSPYAAYRLERILCSNAPSPCWHIESSGILPKPGRQPPHEAQIAAQTLGTPIDAHSSRHSAPCDLTQHHVILIFDRQNLHHLRDTGILGHPGIAVAMLGDYLPPSRQGCEISDPYGGDINEFIQTYRVIDEGLTALTQATQRQHTS